MLTMGKLIILLCFLAIHRCAGDDDWDRSPGSPEIALDETTTETPEELPTSRRIVKKVSWDASLFSAPKLIGALGEVMAASAETDFDMEPYRGRGSNLIRHSRFRPAALHLVNEGWTAMGAIEGDMQKVRLHSMSIPNNAKKLLQFLKTPNAALAKKFSNIPVSAIEQGVEQILEARKDSKKKFNQWRALLNIMNKRMEDTGKGYERRGTKTDTETEQAKTNLDDVKQEYKEAERAFKEADSALDEARDAYNKGLDKLAGGTGSRRNSGRGRGSSTYGDDAGDDDDDDDDDDTAAGVTNGYGEGTETITTEEVDKLRAAMTKAQKKYDRAYRKFREAAEKLKNAKVTSTGLKFENKRLNSVDQVIEKSVKLFPKALEDADILVQFFDSLDIIVKDRLKKSLKAAKEVVDEVIGKENPRNALVADSDLRERLVLQVTKVVNDSAVANVLATAYGDVSGRYVVDNLGKLVKLQNAEGEDLENKLKKFRDHISAANGKIKEAINKAAAKFPAISREWNVVVAGFNGSLQPRERAAATA